MAARAEVHQRPIAGQSFVVPPGCTLSPTQLPIRPSMPSVEAGAHAAARHHKARAGYLAPLIWKQSTCTLVVIRDHWLPLLYIIHTLHQP